MHEFSDGGARAPARPVAARGSARRRSGLCACAAQAAGDSVGGGGGVGGLGSVAVLLPYLPRPPLLWRNSVGATIDNRILAVAAPLALPPPPLLGRPAGLHGPRSVGLGCSVAAAASAAAADAAAVAAWLRTTAGRAAQSPPPSRQLHSLPPSLPPLPPSPLPALSRLPPPLPCLPPSTVPLLSPYAVTQPSPVQQPPPLPPKLPETPSTPSLPPLPSLLHPSLLPTSLPWPCERLAWHRLLQFLQQYI